MLACVYKIVHAENKIAPFFYFSLTMTTALNFFNNDHLHGSVASGQLYLVHRLIANGCDPNLPHTISGLRPIHFAASRGHVNLVRYLVESSHCQVDAIDKEGEVTKPKEIL
jgi:ankyrin repeat protein